MADSMEDLDKLVLEPSVTNVLGTPITLDDVRAKIKKLSNIEGEDLKREMTYLKHALRVNPEAANLLLPEEIGEMVQSIYKLTNKVVAAQAAKATVSKSKKIDVTKLKEMPSDF